MRGFNYKKAVQSLNFLAHKAGGRFNKMKAVKMIWLADRYHLRKFARTITSDNYFALKFGPVPSCTYDILKSSDYSNSKATTYAEKYIQSKGKYEYISIAAIDEKVFSKTDLNTLELIYRKFGDQDHFALSSLSHNFPEWQKYETAFGVDQNQRFDIEIEDFFKNASENSGLFLDSDEFLEVSKSIFQNNREIIAEF